MSSYARICPSCGWEIEQDARSCPQCGWGKGKREISSPAPAQKPSRCQFNDHGYLCQRRATNYLRDSTAFCPEHFALVVLALSPFEARRYHEEATSEHWTLRMMREAIEAEATPAMRVAKSIKDIEDPEEKRAIISDLLSYLKESMRGFGKLPYDPTQRQG